MGEANNPEYAMNDPLHEQVAELIAERDMIRSERDSAIRLLRGAAAERDAALAEVERLTDLCRALVGEEMDYQEKGEAK